MSMRYLQDCWSDNGANAPPGRLLGSERAQRSPEPRTNIRKPCDTAWEQMRNAKTVSAFPLGLPPEQAELVASDGDETGSECERH
jgi:hypothetical protein